MASEGSRGPDLAVLYHGESQPFSRGLLARSIHAAGVELDRAYVLVLRLQEELLAEGAGVVDSDELARRVGDLLERSEGAEAASRYRLVRGIRRLPRPLVIYLGGATGTGKSTLALDLAPLLRIYRINATDTIRQVMRMVFAPAILPALHHSSFELPREDRARRLRPDGRPPAGDEFDERLIREFEEQATRVCVGVRAVVERAVMENLSVLVEGVHLTAPLVPFPDLEGSAYQVALLLTTEDEELHRARFAARGRREGRAGERYLDHFHGIRTLQDHLVSRAEAHGIPRLETTDRDTTLSRAMLRVTALLEEQIPSLRAGPPVTRPGPVPTLLLFVDGLGDRPVRALSGRTPLEAAELPTFDRLAREGRSGLADPIAPGSVPDTAAGSLALFGQSPRALRRGPVEALGAGIELGPGDVALRGNLATLDEAGRVIDRRAGRIRAGAEELAAALDRPPLPEEWSDYTVRVRMGTEHRLAVVLQGDALSPAVAGSDPGDGAPPGPPLAPRAIDPADSAAVRTARLLALFEEHARRVLAEHPINRRRVEAGRAPANAVLTRGAGRVHRLQRLEVAGVPLADRLRLRRPYGARAGGLARRRDGDLARDDRQPRHRPRRQARRGRRGPAAQRPGHAAPEGGGHRGPRLPAGPQDGLPRGRGPPARRASRGLAAGPAAAPGGRLRPRDALGVRAALGRSGTGADLGRGDRAGRGGALHRAGGGGGRARPPAAPDPAHPAVRPVTEGRPRIGSSTRTRVPAPSSLATSTLPPALWATCLTIASPRPVPPSARARPLSTR